MHFLECSRYLLKHDVPTIEIKPNDAEQLVEVEAKLAKMNEFAIIGEKFNLYETQTQYHRLVGNLTKISSIRYGINYF